MISTYLRIPSRIEVEWKSVSQIVFVGELVGAGGGYERNVKLYIILPFDTSFLSSLKNKSNSGQNKFFDHSFQNWGIKHSEIFQHNKMKCFEIHVSISFHNVLKPQNALYRRLGRGGRLFHLTLLSCTPFPLLRKFSFQFF